MELRNRGRRLLGAQTTWTTYKDEVTRVIITVNLSRSCARSTLQWVPPLKSAHQTCSWFTVAQRAGGDSKDKKNFYTVSVPILLPHIPVIPELGASYAESTQEETTR